MKVLIWGTGYIYNQVKNSLKYFELTNQIEIIGVTMSSVPSTGKIDNYVIYSHDQLKELEFDYIVIMSDKYFCEIGDTILGLGISKEKILSYKMFQIPNVNLNEYISIKESGLSIISNNCWGGVVYSTLGLECLSPTKNLFFQDKDYIKFLKNMKFYLDEYPEHSYDNVDVHSLKKYPVLKLKDIEIHCNHSDNAGVAIEDWMRRVKKINFENLYVEMYTEDKEIAEEFLKLNNFKNKLCFVPWEMRHDDTISLDLQDGKMELWEAVLKTAVLNNDVLKYDLIKLLCGKKELRIK